MRAALRVLAGTPTEGRRIAVLGGMLELGDFAPELTCRGRPRGRKDGRSAAGLRPVTANAMCRARTRRALPGRRPLPRTMRSSLRCEETCRAGDTLLFKGSHGMHMEQVLARLLKNESNIWEE